MRTLALLLALAGCAGARSPVPDAAASAGEATARPRGVVLIIGDGTGVGQITAGRVAKGAPLHWERFEVVGLQTTWSASSRVTDSAAGATAMALGRKTHNGWVGVDADGEEAPSILHLAEAKGMATGVVVTSRITHATPASFVAHHRDRRAEQAIALDFLDVDLDVAFGGGRDMFDARDDGRRLTAELGARGVQVVSGVDAALAARRTPLYGFIAEGDPPAAGDGRHGVLGRLAVHAMDLLSADPDGFLLVVEGSQVDWAGHDNDAGRLQDEVLDLDDAIGAILDAAGPDVLVIATADHETGGLDTLPSAADPTGAVELRFGTTGHTADMVPVFARGPGAARFGGVSDNTELPHRVAALLGLPLTRGRAPADPPR